jgi:hypothetical protein
MGVERLQLLFYRYNAMSVQHRDDQSINQILFGNTETQYIYNRYYLHK